MRKFSTPVLLLLLTSMCAFGSLAFSISNSPIVTPPGGIFDPADCQSGSGSCVIFAGEIDPDPTTDFFITSIQLNFTSAPVVDPQDFLMNNDSFFANNFAIAFIPSESDSGTPVIGPIFEVDVLPIAISDPSTPLGVYQGTATLNYGPDSNPADSTFSVSAPFEVDVMTPEPATFGSAAITLIALAWRMRRRRVS